MNDKTRIIGPIFCVFLICGVSFSCGKKEDVVILDDYSIIYPNGTEALIKGITHTIRWNAPHSSTVDVELYKSSEYYSTIQEGAINSGEHDWNIPEYIPEDSDFHIRIVDQHNSDYNASSINSFRILSPVITSTITDIRDGQTYKIVKIGDQWWMAENLNYNIEEGSFCYDEDLAVAEELARLYTLNAALKYPLPGWHLPSDGEWKMLEAYLGITPDELDLYGNRGHFAGSLLKSMGGTGFNALFGGYHNSYENGIGHRGWEAHFWTSTTTSIGNPIIRVIINNLGGVSRIESTRHDGSSVRYVKD